MSSLLNSYRKLTDEVNQGVFNTEEMLLSQGRVYKGSQIELVLGDAAAIDFVLSSGDDTVAIADIMIQTTSEEVLVEFFGGPVFTVGTPIPLVNQLVGSVRPALASLVLNPTITDDGTLGTSSIIRGVAGQGNREGFSEGDESSLSILAPNTDILLRVTNQGAVGVADFSVRIGELATVI